MGAPSQVSDAKVYGRHARKNANVRGKNYRQLYRNQGKKHATEVLEKTVAACEAQ